MTFSSQGTRDRRRCQSRVAVVALCCVAISIPPASGQPLPGSSLSITPDIAIAGAFKTVTFTFTVGETGLESGGGIRFELPVAYGETEPYFWSKPQTTLPDAPGYLQARSSSDVPLTLTTYGIAGGIFECAVGEEPLTPGESITISYRGLLQSLARPVPMRYQIRISGDDAWEGGPDPPTMHIVPREALTLITTTRADIQAGQPVPVSVVAIDRFGNRATGYRGTIQLLSSEPTAWLPTTEYTFTEQDAGVHTFDGVRMDSTGFQRIRAIDPDRDLQISSHYAWISTAAPSLNRFFGDTHFHTGTGTGNRGFLSLSDAPTADVSTVEIKKFQAINAGGDHRGNFTDAETAYAYARDVVRLDFASSAEHDAVLLDSAAWEESQSITESVNEPGTFTTLFAYEWTPGFTHHIVLYKDPGQSVFARDQYPDLPSLWAALDQQGAPTITIPHISWAFDDHTIWNDVNNTYRKLGEIYSLWNNRFLVQPDDIPQRFELGIGNKWSYQYAWHHGHRVGLVGSSDNHLGRPGANNYTIYTHHTGGFAVAVAGDNTRDRIWEAFQNRRTYATTGTRIYLDFQADGHSMGAEYTTAEPPVLSVRVAGTNKLALVEIVKYQSGSYTSIHTEEPDRDTSIFDVTDEAFDQDCMYYLRVTQEDEYPGRPWSHSTSEMAWSSPIWVRFGGVERLDGAIIRGRRDENTIALVFTGDEYADGAGHIREVLAKHGVAGSFFFTGNFYRNEDFAEEIHALAADGHYLGPHSDRHLLYNSWENRDSLLVSREVFEKDILDNYGEMARFGIGRGDGQYFMPPYEWYNREIAGWTDELGLTLINYSPGTRSHADYTTPEMDHYEPSGEIFASIESYESEDPDGLSGFILLSHVGTAPERTDKFYEYLGPLIRSLRERGYDFVRIDELIEP